jgi:hypothetical protein
MGAGTNIDESVTAQKMAKGKKQKQEEAERCF